MVVRFFDFLCLISITFPNIIVTTGERVYQVNDLASAGSFRQDVLENRPYYPSNELYFQKEGLGNRYNGKSSGKNPLIAHVKRISNSKLGNPGSHGAEKRRDRSNNMAERVDRRYILVLNVGVAPNSFTSFQEKSFSHLLTQNLRKHEFPDTKCTILHNTPISRAKVQLEVYCKDAKKWSRESFIPAPSLAKSMDTLQMRPFISKFNITAYGIKNTPEIDLQVYQEMWFPVAVVAGISMLLIVFAIACLLICRKRTIETADEEEQTPKQADSEKLMYPPVHPIQTMSASMIQPGGGQVYTISGIPLKPRKWKGSQKSLLDRRGSTASLVLDLTSSSTDLRPGSPTSLSIKESPVEEKLLSKSNPCIYEQLEECVDSTKQLYAEFWEIPMNHPAPEERIPGSSYRNRYPFILPNSRTRVILPEVPDDPLSTYINANVIRGYGGEQNAFIATQGPLSCTINDFWRMIWYHHCPIIVMITKLKERNETKCERYWPDPTFRMQEKYGDVVVTFDSALGRDGYQITSLYVSHSQSLEAPRRVYHYWYTAWPDHGVPESPRQLLQLVDEVHLAQDREGGKSGPAVVHCSAGIGRTGCFTATSIGIKQIQNENCIDILKIVCLMRIDRGGMVETDTQYEFVYHTLYHHWTQLRSGIRRETNDSVLEAMFEDK